MRGSGPNHNMLYVVFQAIAIESFGPLSKIIRSINGCNIRKAIIVMVKALAAALSLTTKSPLDYAYIPPFSNTQMTLHTASQQSVLLIQ